MDTDKALEEALSLATEMLDLADHDIDPVDARRLSELLVGLDSWLQRGGVLPARWRRGRS